MPSAKNKTKQSKQKKSKLHGYKADNDTLMKTWQRVSATQADQFLFSCDYFGIHNVKMFQNWRQPMAVCCILR